MFARTNWRAERRQLTGTFGTTTARLDRIPGVN